MNSDTDKSKQSTIHEVSDSAWISISDKLPKEGDYVLGYRPFAEELGDRKFTVIEYRGYVNVDHRGNTHGFERCHFVSHWKPLIEPQ